ncbi:NAC domain-containing protein 69-like isoform X2 [Durio zibethinus]|uniref:NAC domain-containing protein 69-like isoform X2 n=1 Tax=Durio zibethinus TaxID=66656 RepID=A0A6P6B2V0_DURZI|nr:NAC domain-containing protein 69-like isoform X2 [Durio zibethinus]
MNFVKGFRFHPTDEELIEYLHIKTFDPDSVVQVIAEVQDICESEPWELPGRSTLQTGDRLWYFMYPPKYKYRNSKLISRTTLVGYWKPTGNARKIINPDTGEEIGSKKTLVFHKGQYNDKNKNRTPWVMHEYELKVTPKATDFDQKTFKLCKLKKKADVSSGEASESTQHSLSNVENHVANNVTSEVRCFMRIYFFFQSVFHVGYDEHVHNYCLFFYYQDPLDPNGSYEPEASNDHDGVHNHCSSVETYAGKISNQHNMVNEGENSNLSSNVVNHVAEDAVLKEPLYLKEVSTEGSGPKDNRRVQNLYSTIEQNDKSSNSVLTNHDETVPTEAEGFKVPFNLEHLADGDLIPTELLYDLGLSLDELSPEPEAANKSNWIQERNTQQCSATYNEDFGLPCIGVMMESSNSMEKSTKRPRLQYDGLHHHVETGEAQPWGEEYLCKSQSIQTDSCNRRVTTQIGGSITYQ